MANLILTPGCGCGCGSTGGGNTVVLPNCGCTTTPISMSVTVSFPPEENTHTYGGQYVNASLAYYPSGPPYLVGTTYAGKAGIYSTSTWITDSGSVNYYTLTCFAASYTISMGTIGPGIPTAPGQVYSWTLGGTTPVNFCNPFALNVGFADGVFFNGTFVVS